MSIGDEIPFRRSARTRETGSLVLDQHRKAAVRDVADESPSQRRREPQSAC